MRNLSLSLVRFFTLRDALCINALLFCYPLLVGWHLETTNQRASLLCLFLKLLGMYCKPLVDVTGLDAVLANANGTVWRIRSTRSLPKSVRRKQCKASDYAA